MGKCVKNIALSVIAAVFGVLTLSGPVFANSTPSTPVDTPDTSTTAPTDTDTPADTTTETPTPTDSTNPTTATNGEETVQTSCYDQVGGLGWIICPGTGLFGKIIDGAYNVLTNLIKTDPIPSDHDSPLYIVWDYFKNITNILFIVFFLVVIFSQISGIGISNYGIKKVLPRLIITAILVNLSYIICTIAVDVSNIIGNSIYHFFGSVQEVAVQNGAITTAASTSSVSSVISSLLGVGAAGTVVIAAASLGSYSGILWFLIPILLGGVIAVVSAAITMAARQALIFLLIMASPLAFIAYMLPNTEKWFTKWYSMLFQMLIFFPMFSVLYGASQLCGLVIISTAITPEGTDWLRVILGIAVKILPLVMSIPLMRMSSSILGKISGVVGGISNPARGAIGRFASEKQGYAKSRAVSSRGRLPSTRLAKFLEKNRAQREFDASEQKRLNDEILTTSAMRGWYNRKGQLSRRGVRHNYNEALLDQQAIMRTNIATDFDEGFETDGTDARVRRGDYKKVGKTNRLIENNVINKHVAESRARSVTLKNIESRANLIRDNIQDETSQIHQQVLDAFNIDSGSYDSVVAKKNAYDEAAALVAAGATLTAEQQTAYNRGDLTNREKALYDKGQKAINATLADAIAAKRKVDHEARGALLELYDDYEAGPRIKQQLIHAFENKDYNSMSAALEVMYKRGDKDDIGDVLRRYSKEAYGENNIRFQKELNDICLSFKAEDVDVAQWAKANMMRRGMNGKGINIESFIDYETWSRNESLVGDVDISKAKKTSRIELAKAMSSWEPIATADRTMWNQLLADQKDGVISHYTDENGNDVIDLAGFPIKYLRSAVCSGRMDGERLESFNKWFTGGYNKNVDMGHSDNTLFREHQSQYANNILKFLSEMTAPQLATLKTATLEAFNSAMLAIDGGDPALVETINGREVSKRLHDSLAVQINQLNTNASMASIRTGMNPAVRQMLGIVD